MVLLKFECETRKAGVWSFLSARLAGITIVNTWNAFINIEISADVAVFSHMTVLFLERMFLPVSSVFGKSAQTDAKRIICNLMFAVKGTHQPRHIDAGGLFCGADALLIVFPPTSVSKTFKQVFHTTRLISIWWCQMGAVLHLQVSLLSFISPSLLRLRSGRLIKDFMIF